MEKAYLQKDFETFGRITMQDSNQFHSVCLDTFPPIFYMNDISRSARLRPVTPEATGRGVPDRAEASAGCPASFIPRAGRQLRVS